MGICDVSNVPGFVPDRPLTSSFFQSGPSLRSIVAADIAHRSSATSSLISSSP